MGPFFLSIWFLYAVAASLGRIIHQSPFSSLPILLSPPLLSFSQFLKHFKARPSYVALLRRNRGKGPAKEMGASSSVRPYPKKERRRRQQQLGRKLWGEGGGEGLDFNPPATIFHPCGSGRPGSGWRRRGRKIFFHARPHSYEPRLRGTARIKLETESGASSLLTH